MIIVCSRFSPLAKSTFTSGFYTASTGSGLQMASIESDRYN